MNEAYLWDTEYTDTQIIIEGESLEHEAEQAILVYPMPSKEPPKSPGKFNSFKHGKQTNKSMWSCQNKKVQQKPSHL